METKSTLYTSMKQQIDGIKDENIRVSEKLQHEIEKNEEREQQILSLGKENQMLRETISQLETKYLFEMSLYSNIEFWF